MATSVSVMTFNLRTATPKDGINEFWNRTGRICAFLKEKQPDLIGFQEATAEMRAWLFEALAPMGYTLLGCGRDKDLGGEGTTIAYRTSAFELRDCETFWLSDTPQLPGSRFKADQSGCPRIATAALLKHRDAETPFLFLNTHLDHKGTQARLLGAVQILQYIAGRGRHFVITGDMNAKPDSPEILAFLQAAPVGVPLRDLSANIKGSFHGFRDRTPEEMHKIDYIFTDLETDGRPAELIDDSPIDGIYLSDHRPICATVLLA